MIMLSGDLSEQYKDRSNAVLQKGLRQGRKIVHDGIGVSIPSCYPASTQFPTERLAPPASCRDPGTLLRHSAHKNGAGAQT